MAQLLLQRSLLCCSTKTSFIARLSLILCGCGNCATLAVIGNSDCRQKTADSRQQTVAYPDRQRDKQAQVRRRRGAKVNLSLLLIAHTTRWPESKLQLRFFCTRTQCTVWGSGAGWQRECGMCVLIELHANCPCKLHLQPRGGNCIALDAAVATLLLIKEFQ